MEIIKKLNGVEIVKNSEGKFGLREIIDGKPTEPAFRYKTIQAAETIAQAVSDENDNIDQYEQSNK